MAWTDDMVQIVRGLINDLDSATYSNARLQEIIVIAGVLVYKEVDFDKNYVINVNTPDITPDPTDATRDDSFINLVSIRSACIILGSEAKTAAGQNFRIVDGPSTIDTAGSARSKQTLADNMCEDYIRAKLDFQAGNSRAGQAILTAYTREGGPPGPIF